MVWLTKSKFLSLSLMLPRRIAPQRPSTFETDWANVLYMKKGADGVGYKKNRDFAVWPVLSINDADPDIVEFLQDNGAQGL